MNQDAGPGPFPSVPAQGAPVPAGEEVPSPLWRRFSRLFHAPQRAFAPPLHHSVWITALVLLSALQLGQGWLLRDLVREQLRTGITMNEQIPEEQRETILQRLDEGYASTGGYLRQSLTGVAGNSVLAYVLPAVLYLLGLNFGLGARASFREIFAVTTFSNLIIIVRELVRVPLMLARGNLYVFVSPAALVDPDHRALVWALDRFDLFTLYRLALLTLGFAALSGLAPKRTAIPVILVWLVVTLVGIAFMLSPIGRMFG